MMLTNVLSTGPTRPAMVISMNIPKIYSGSNGMITVMIVRVIMSRNSPNPRRRATDPQKAMPNPITKANIRAVITPNSGGISTVK